LACLVFSGVYFLYVHPSVFIRPMINNLNANKHAVGQDSETRVLNTALNTNKVQ